MKPILTVAMAGTQADLEDISALNQENLRTHIDPAVAKDQGFVTWRYDIGLLQRMHAIAPSILCRCRDLLAGYALTATKEMASEHRELSLLLPQLDELLYRGTPLHHFSYYVMGQLCVAVPFRGMGAVELMYAMHREVFLRTFELMVLTISTKNTRSIRVHERIGFEEIHHFNDHHGGWNVYVWDGGAKK